VTKSLKIALAAAALVSTQAFAAGAPFEVTQFDRILPDVKVMAAASGSMNKAGAPFEATEFDRTLPNVAVKATAERTIEHAQSNWLEPAIYAQ
jgi:hypothetical protein